MISMVINVGTAIKEKVKSTLVITSMNVKNVKIAERLKKDIVLYAKKKLLCIGTYAKNVE